MLAISWNRIRATAGRMLILAGASIGLISGCASAWADDVAAFYNGKHITIIVPSATGGSYDLYSRIMARHYGRYIPGNPTFVVQNMPGAGGRRGTGYIYNAAPRDGTTIGAIHNFMAFDPLFEGANYEAQFDPRKFVWLGSVTTAVSVAIDWHTSPVKTYKDLYEKELVVGGVGTDTLMVTNPYLLGGLLGMKFKVVAGYMSSGEVDIAMERGEVQGRIDGGWISLKQCCMDKVKNGDMRILFQMGLEKHPELPDVPLALDFARNDEERRVLETAFLPYEFGRPFITTPEIPADRLAALRKAFMETMKDPQFLAEVKKGNMEVNPIPPERLEQLVKQAYSLPASLIARVNALQKPPSTITKVTYKSVRAKLGDIDAKGHVAIDVIDGGKEMVTVRAPGTDVMIGGKKAEASALKTGMVCTVAYLGDKTIAQSVKCD